MKKFENLGRSLSNSEKKKIMGGTLAPPGTCCYHDAGWANYECCYGCTLAEAKAEATALAIATGNHWYYCCASC